jgi:nucleoside-diphosphate-sugar epimerase
MWLISPRHVVANLIVGHEAPAASFGTSRNVNVPGISVSVGDMVAALRRVAGDAVARRVSWQVDPAIDRIVRTWPRDFDASLGRRLGMRADADFDSVVRQYVEDELPR